MFDYSGMANNAMTMDPRMVGGGVEQGFGQHPGLGQGIPPWLQQMLQQRMGGMGGQMGRFPGMRPDIMRGNFGQTPFSGMSGRGMTGGPVPGMGGVAQSSGMPQQPMIGPGGPVGPVY